MPTASSHHPRTISASAALSSPPAPASSARPSPPSPSLALAHEITCPHQAHDPPRPDHHHHHHPGPGPGPGPHHVPPPPPPYPRPVQVLNVLTLAKKMAPSNFSWFPSIDILSGSVKSTETNQTQTRMGIFFDSFILSTRTPHGVGARAGGQTTLDWRALTSSLSLSC